MGKMKEIAEIPREKVGEDVLQKLATVAPSKLRKVIQEAKAQEPPNEAMIGAAGALAYAHAGDVGYFSPSEREDYALIASEAFPDAAIGEFVDIHPLRGSNVGDNPSGEDDC